MVNESHLLYNLPDDVMATLCHLSFAQEIALNFQHSINRNILLIISPVVHDNHEYPLDFKVTIYFLRKYLASSVPGLQCDEGMEDWQRVTCSIGEVFDCFFHELMTCAKPLFAFSQNSHCLDEVTALLSDLDVLSSAVNLLADPSKLDCNYIETASHSLSCLSMNWVFSNRKIYKTGNKVCYQWECKDLFQVCFSILDFLCRFSYKGPYDTKVHKIFLHRCKFCGRYFVTDVKNTKYCKRTDERGQRCSQKAEAARKKNYALRKKSEAQELVTRIANRLYAYRRSRENSRQNRIKDAEYQRRTDLHELFKKRKSEHSTQPDYLEWSIEATSLLPQSRKESYDKFYEWLLERS